MVVLSFYFHNNVLHFEVWFASRVGKVLNLHGGYKTSHTHTSYMYISIFLQLFLFNIGHIISRAWLFMIHHLVISYFQFVVVAPLIRTVQSSIKFFHFWHAFIKTCRSLFAFYFTMCIVQN